jgi:hypothetical protein
MEIEEQERDSFFLHTNFTSMKSIKDEQANDFKWLQMFKWLWRDFELGSNTLF